MTSDRDALVELIAQWERMAACYAPNSEGRNAMKACVADLRAALAALAPRREEPVKRLVAAATMFLRHVGRDRFIENEREVVFNALAEVRQHYGWTEEALIDATPPPPPSDVAAPTPGTLEVQWLTSELNRVRAELARVQREEGPR